MRSTTRLVCVGLVCWMFATHPASAQSAPNPPRSFYQEIVHTIAESMYALAWPTAKYKDVSFGGVESRERGIVVTFRLFGKSALDGSDLWTDASVLLRDGKVADFAWGQNNAVLMKPGETVRILANGLARLNADIDRARAQHAGAQVPVRSAPAGSSSPARSALRYYKHKSGWFSLAVLPNYVVVTDSDRTSADGTRSVSVTLAARDAERNGVSGWLSDGVRVRIDLPPQGSVWAPAFQSSRTSDMAGILDGYARYEVKLRKAVTLAGLAGIGVAVQGDSPKISETEAGYLYKVASSLCLVSIEVATPLSRSEVLEALHDAFLQSFRTACNP